MSYDVLTPNILFSAEVLSVVVGCIERIFEKHSGYDLSSDDRFKLQVAPSHKDSGYSIHNSKSASPQACFSRCVCFKSI